MKYTYKCEKHGSFEVERPMVPGPEPTEFCIKCGEDCPRDYRADLKQEPIYNAQGFHRTDYWKQSARGEPADKKEWLNSNWSKHYNEPPPKPDSKGTYDGN